MKKKLIAIVASFAMVATMVPATAFAAADKVGNMDGITIGLPEGAQVTEIDEFLDSNGGDHDKTYEQLTGEVINADVTGTYANGKLTLTGTVPYTAGLTDFSSKEAMQSGNYIAFAINAPKPKTTGAEGWAFTNTRNNVDANGQSITEYILSTYKYEGGRDDETIVLRVNGNTEKTFTVYYLGKDSANGNASAFHADRLGVDASTTIYSTKAAMDEVIAKANNNIAGTKKLTVDLSGLTLLTKVQTASKQGFVSAVEEIGALITSETNDAPADVDLADPTTKLARIGAVNKVTPQYRQKTVAARAIYGSLDATVKSIVDDAVAARETTTLKTAYKALETAEDNIKAYDTLTSVAALVAALPAEKDFDLKDAAAVKQVKAAQAAVTDLPAGAAATLMTDEFLTKNQIDNYNAVVKKLNDAGVQDVIDAIDALPRLPKEFTDKASVDAVFEPLTEVQDAYKDLDTTVRGNVTNAAKLDKYQDDYDELILDLVNPIWKEAAKIDVDKALTEEEKALVNELKTYVEGGYLDARDITGYKKATYDALIAALGNEPPTPDISLKDAVIAAIADQAYTGAAIEPAVIVTDKDGNAIPAEGYTVNYKDNTNVGTATVTVTNKKDETDVISATFTIKAATLTDAMVKNIANVTYTGKAIEPAVSAAAGVTFDVAYKNNTAVGKATATITGTGNYTGTITKNFIVKPAKEAISSLKAGKKSLTVAYNAQTGAKYRVVYSPAKGQAKAVNTTATKKTIKNLKAGKTYKVKVRAYKTIDGTPYNGTYSTVKKVKVK